MRAPLAIAAVLRETNLSLGSVVQMLDAARGLAAHGHRVLVITRRSSEIARLCAEAGVQHLPLPLRFEFDVGSMRRLRLAAERRALDIVHAYDGTAHAIALGALGLGARFGLLVNRGHSFRLSRWSALKFRARRVRRIVAEAESIRRALITEARVAPHTIEVVFAGVDLARFDPTRANPAKVRAELGIPGDALVVGQVGMRDWKGWKELLQAFPAVRADHPKVCLLLVACTSERQRLGVLELAREMGLSGAVCATLERRDIPDVLSACDVVVDASWAGTGISGTLREAMALGRPVVATTAGGNQELITDKVSGLLVPPREQRTLAAAINRLLRDRALSERVGAAARKVVRRRFTAAMRVGRLASLYRRVARTLR
jgi:glycosyltransferase involved in cell wall biosynthesis